MLAVPAGAATGNTCGGAVSDWVGEGELDTAFEGSVTLPGGSTRAISIAPQALGSTLVRTEVTASAEESRAAVGNFVLRINSLGRGQITFPTYAGESGVTTGTLCPVGTRVTKITGKVSTAGVEGKLDFTASRT
ncbi:hypothetical protein [Streptomyces sp. 1331.2]|uniref:hypothetical protein n=1 Tax=Streptomyces sp. 1331.2 TaxID=1938835 RepID=UPI00117F58EA|nr:hypothetical protein [Streptomyces sp. 1331.2]